MTISEQVALLINLIDIMHRNLSDDDLKRYDVYNEVINLFDDQDVLAEGLGEDDIYDKVYKEIYLTDDSEDREDE